LFWAGHSRKKELRRGEIPRGRFTNFVESLVAFVCDEMIYDVMGKEVGRRYAPLFLTQFFFIWLVNLLGNLPFGPWGGAPTANIAVTAALASTTLVVMVAAGIKASGPIGMWRDLLPKGLPPVIREILFVVEFVGFFIKPFALTVRLFANMFGGHLVVLSLFGLIYLFESYVIMGAVLPMSIFVGILELFVATLQAFIFTFLSIMFVQLSLHPEH
jgi:F-type H+-transporting ATPase subunit a